ncbi:MAG: sigma-70 family RNA polymerase sigma factor [Actinomycetota bacterium]
MEQRTDIRLWEAAAGGDAEAFGQIFDRYSETVYNFCFRRCGSWSQAEDLTSSVFLQAWMRRGEVHPTSDTLRPWLIGVSINVLRNWSRTERRARARLVRASTRAAAVPDFADDLVGRLDDERWAMRVLGVFEHLPRDDQDILSLAAWGNLSYEEIGEVLALPLGTVRSRLSRARRRLTELAERYGHEGTDSTIRKEGTS